MAAPANDGVAFWKRWIQLQVEHNIDHMASVSIKNFHFPGLNYVCFEFSPTQTIRLYIVDPSERLDTREVQIHNHLYDSQILVLHGWVRNRVYKIDHEAPQAELYNAFRLTSALEPSNAERRIKLDFFAQGRAQSCRRDPSRAGAVAFSKAHGDPQRGERPLAHDRLHGLRVPHRQKALDALLPARAGRHHPHSRLLPALRARGAARLGPRHARPNALAPGARGAQSPALPALLTRRAGTAEGRPSGRARIWRFCS